MKWGRHRKQKQQQQQQQQGYSSSSSSSSSFSSSIFRLLPLSWISKLRQTKTGKRAPPPPPTDGLPDFWQKHGSPEFRPFSSDHLFVSPAIFDRLVTGDEAPRRHSCATADEVRFFERSRARGDSLGSARFNPEFPLLSCRSCRAEPLSLTEKKESLRRQAPSSPAPDATLGVGEKTRLRRSRGRSLESFAVVKKSTDPQRDFRESMVEMIEKNRMGRAEELERLLACYLALNAEEYHDVIVKVFRQVWLELEPPPPAVSGRRRREGPPHFPATAG